MIIFGRRGTDLETSKIDLQCKNCDSKEGLIMKIYQNYLHIFWIPVLPFSKGGVSYCPHCKHVLDDPEFKGELKEHYSRMKSISKAPIWTFSGIIVFIMLIIWVSFNEKQNEKNSYEYIESPQIGDIYEVKYGNGDYSILKVENFSWDTVIVMSAAQYSTNKSSNLNKIKEMENSAFDETPVVYYKSELTDMLKQGKILKVERN